MILPVAPEEEELITYDENRVGVWASFHLSSEYTSGAASGEQKNGVVHIEQQQLDRPLRRTPALDHGYDRVRGGVRRSAGGAVQSAPHVAGARGNGCRRQALSFIQEDKMTTLIFM